MIKVASYNIRKGIGTDRVRRPERIVTVLREVDADIIALQEADRRFGTRERVLTGQLLASHSPWREISFGARAASMGWHGNTILIRKAWSVIDFEPIHLPSLEPRGAVMADVRTPVGPLRIIGMHLDLSGLWRRRQARTIITHVGSSTRPLPTIIMGDMNEWSAAAGCISEFIPHYRVADTGPSFHARRPIARLDRIMASPDLAIEDCGVHASATARTASDHLPIWASITLPS